MNFTINPEYEKLVSPLKDDQYRSLKKSIKKNGLWMPIIVNSDGVILDGHTRYKICKDLNIPLKHAIREFPKKYDEFIFVGEINMARRQMSDLENIALVMKLEPFYERRAKDNQSNAGKGLPTLAKVDTREELARKAGVSHGTYDKGKKILEILTPEIIEKINAGSSTINKEYQKIRKDEKKEKRQEEIQKIQVNLPETVTLHNQEFQSAPIPPNSVSLIITDPPYHEKYLYLYEDLAVHAVKVLRDGGSLICYVGHYAIGTVINMMEKHGLSFHWPIAVIHSGPSASVFGRKILVGYKPMLWFVKGKYTGEFVRDTIQSEFQGKELHEWAQSTVESDYYIKYLTIPNEIVYDPFMGQGTFGVSAVNQNRQFIGCEVDANHFANAERMISNVN